MTKLVKLLAIGGSSTAVAGGAAAGVAVAVTHKKDNKAQNKGYDLTIEAMDKTLAANAKSSLDAELAAKAAAQKEMLDAIAKMDNILQAYWDYSNDAEYNAKRDVEHAEHRAEVEAYNKEQQEQDNLIERQEASHEVRHNLNNKKYNLNEDQANDAIFWAQQLSKSTHDFIRIISSRTQGVYALDSQFENLVNEVVSLDAIIESFEPNLKDLSDISAEIKSTISEIKLNVAPTAIPQLIPTAIPQLTASAIYSAPGFSTEYKAGKIMIAGDFVKAFRQEFLAKFTPEQLTQARSSTNFDAAKYMSDIHNLVQQLFLKYFPQFKNEFDNFVSGGYKNWWEAIFYAEIGSSNYGIKFNLLNYLLNPENENKATFSEFVRGEWDQRGSHHQAKFEGVDWIGQSNPGLWDIDNWYKSQKPSVDYDAHIEQKIKDFFAAIDKQTTTSSNTALYNVNTFNASIDELKSKPEILAPNRANEHAVEYIKMAQPGHIFEGEHGVKFQVVSSAVNSQDVSKVNIELAAVATWALPQTFSVEIGGFKVSSAPTPAQFIAELKTRLQNNSAAKGILSRTTAFNSLTAARSVLVKYLSDLHVNMSASDVNKLIGHSQSYLFYYDSLTTTSATTYEQLIAGRSFSSSSSESQVKAFAHAMDTL